MTFFWRIFLSLWVIVVATMMLTLWVGGWLPNSDNGGVSGPAAEQIVALIAQDLRRQLASDPRVPIEAVVTTDLLDYAPILEVYVLDPSGNDVLDRSLPEAVADVARAQSGSPPVALNRAGPRVHVSTEGLGGYFVIGYEGFLPMRDVLMRPGGRGLLAAIALLVSASVSLMLARFIVLPVHRLRQAEQKVAAGDLSVRVAHTVGSRTDDIAKLARDFDVMTEKVHSLLQSQQRLMRDVSHELRSPLARLHALLSIARQRAGAEGTEQIDRMEVELQRLDDLIGEILAYARLEAQESIERHPTDLVDLMQNVVDDASLEAQAAGKDLCVEAPARCLIDLDSGMIHRAVENVVRNALKYTADGTSVDICIEERQRTVRIVVDDHGPGVPQESIDKIFEPFYRAGDSRSTRSGSGGIGLAIAQRIIRLHGGTISVRNLEQGGLRVEIVLPRGERSSPDRESDEFVRQGRRQ